MKKLFTLVLSALILSVCAFATPEAVENAVEVDLAELYSEAETVASGTCGTNLTWILDSEGTLTISGTGSMYGYSNAPWYSKRESIKNAVIGDSVTSIGWNVFYDCTSLTSIDIPDSVTSIGYCAFSDCTSLASIEIPDSLTSIDIAAFRYCTSLTSIEIPDSVTSIGNYAFYNCTSLASIDIPDSVTSIGNYAFYNCTSLASVEIPDSVTSIGGSAFEYCESLASIGIGDSVTSIGEYAFSDCTNITSVEIPDSVTIIGSNAFSCCVRLAFVKIGDGVTNMDCDAFSDCTSLESIIVDENNGKFSSDERGTLFDKDKTLLIKYPVANPNKSYSIPESVKELSLQAFFGCQNLESVYVSGFDLFCDFGHYFRLTGDVLEIVGGLTNVSADIYIDGKLADNITLPKNVFADKRISFHDLKCLKSVVVSEGIEELSEVSFFGCENLERIVIPRSVTTFYGGTFYKCDKLTIYGYAGSHAELFANENNIPFIALDDIVGDINHDSSIDVNDAILILQHSMFPELYPLDYAGDVDFTGDGEVDISDAILLLQHSMFPDLYPID